MFLTSFKLIAFSVAINVPYNNYDNLIIFVCNGIQWRPFNSMIYIIYTEIDRQMEG